MPRDVTGLHPLRQAAGDIMIGSFFSWLRPLSMAAFAVAGAVQLGASCVHAQEVRVQAGPVVVRTALPPYFISFNMNSITFEANYWDNTKGQVRPEVGARHARLSGCHLSLSGRSDCQRFRLGRSSRA